jgi:hypothetical protein
MTDIVEDIETIVIWWGGLPKDFTGIGDVDYALQKLSTLTYFYSTEVAKSYGSHLANYRKRQIGIARHEIGLYGTMPQSKAEKESMVANESLLIEDLVAETDYNEHRLRLSSINRVMDAMRSRIASLRKEQQ